MKEDPVIVEKEKGVAIIYFNQPHIRNAWGAPIASGLLKSLKELENDKDTKVVILTGKGTAFSAGAYLKDQKVHSVGDSIGEEIERNFKGPKTAMDMIADFPKPIIAAINGQASGFGFRVVLCCDIIIVAEDAQMNLPEVSLGIIPGTGGSLRLARFVGKGKAMEMILTCDWLTAHEAYRTGLAARLVPNSELLTTAKNMAYRIAAMPPIATIMAKRSLNEALDMANLKLAAQTDIYRQILMYQTEDIREAHQAWREKRPASFKGK